MRKEWDFEDILDFNYFFQLDNEEKEETEQLHQRDRRFFLADQGENPPSAPSLSYLLKLWLDKRRSEEMQNENSFLPGEAIRRSHGFFRLLLILGGFVIGCGLALSYFVYTGKTPLNVFQFLTIFIVPQLLLIVLLILKAVFSFKAKKQSSGRLLHSLFTRFFFTARKRVLKKLSLNRQTTISALLNREQGSLTFWPLFLASQLFGLAFNCGILAVTILKIMTTDLAFGWQSTLQLGSESLFTVVKCIALPWSWLLSPELSYPSLMEIEGSRIILKDGMLHLLTENLISWWPFLLLCLVFYGLFPRAVLFCSGLLMEQHAFRRHLKQSKYEIISKRMLTPLVSSQAVAENHFTEDSPVVPSMEKNLSAPSRDGEIPVLVLIPDDIDEGNSSALEELLLPHNHVVTEKSTIFKSYDGDEVLLTDIARMSWNSLKGIVILVEAWMAPIEEQIRFLGNIAGSIPGEIEIAIYLLGRPTLQTLFTPPLQEDREMWQDRINRLPGRIICLEPRNTVQQQPS